MDNDCSTKEREKTMKKIIKLFKSLSKRGGV